jgi:hypothetical protein
VQEAWSDVGEVGGQLYGRTDEVDGPDRPTSVDTQVVADH